MKHASLSVVFLTALAFSLAAAHFAPVNTNIPYSDAKPILEGLRENLLPAELRGKTPAELEAVWPDWVSRRDAAIRARVEGGDEDSIIHFLLFGTTFTKRPRATTRELAGLVVEPAEALRSLGPRIEDFAAAVASPGTNERRQFARQVIMRKGIDPATEAGRKERRRYLDERTKIVGGAVRASVLLDPGAELSDKLTLFRDRGLSSDTSIFIDFGIEQALDVIIAKGLIQQGSVRRVAIIGPGLDFTDKLEGYDFYPQQTIQPFAVIDSLIRLGLGKPGGLQVTAFDLSPRVTRHLEAARESARAGSSYALALPRNLDRPWTPNLVEYWKGFGGRIGEDTQAPAPPPSAGRVEVRSVLVRPPVVRSIVPRDLNVVLQRLEPLPGNQFDLDHFDLIVATKFLFTTTCSSNRSRSRILRRCCGQAGSCYPTTAYSSCRRARFTRSAPRILCTWSSKGSGRRAIELSGTNGSDRAEDASSLPLADFGPAMRGPRCWHRAPRALSEAGVSA